MSKEKETASRKEFFLFRWIRRALFPNKELDIYAEEQLQSPLRMVVRNFFSKPLSVVCLFLLIAIMLFVFIAPNYVTLDLGEQDSTLVNIAPGYDMMNIPSELEKKGVRDIKTNSIIAIRRNRQTTDSGFEKKLRTTILNGL